MEKLSKFLNTKSNGGARTAFQLNQAFNLLTFVLEISSSKVATDEIFKAKLSENLFAKFAKKLNQMVKQHLADDESNKEAEEEKEKKEAEEKEKEKAEEKEKTEEDKKAEKKEKQKKQKKKKNKKQEKKSTFDMFSICLANYLDRLFSFEKKLGFLSATTENDLTAYNDKLIKLMQKIASSLNLKNVSHKLENINKKLNNDSNDSDADENEKEGEVAMAVEEKDDN